MIYTPMKVGYVQINQKETLHLLKHNLGGESGREIVQYAALTSQPASRDELKIGMKCTRRVSWCIYWCSKLYM